MKCQETFPIIETGDIEMERVPGAWKIWYCSGKLDMHQTWFLQLLLFWLLLLIFVSSFDVLLDFGFGVFCSSNLTPVCQIWNHQRTLVIA